MFETIHFNQKNAAETFSQSLKETGFAVIDQTDVDWNLIKRVQENWFEFFLSGDKAPYLFDPTTHAGFIPQKLSETAKGCQVKDLKEFFHFFRNTPCPDELKADTLALYDSLNQLAITLLNWVEQSLPESIKNNLSIPLSQMIQNSDKTLLRLIHYPPVPENAEENAVRAAPHEDINLMTILPAANTEGLQVLDSNHQWVSAPTEPGKIIINSGDMLDECTGSYFVATKHRVINPKESENVSRLSFPLFLHPRDDVILSKRHTAASYREERFKELGLHKNNEKH